MQGAVARLSALHLADNASSPPAAYSEDRIFRPRIDSRLDERNLLRLELIALARRHELVLSAATRAERKGE